MFARRRGAVVFSRQATGGKVKRAWWCAAVRARRGGSVAVWWQWRAVQQQQCSRRRVRVRARAACVRGAAGSARAGQAKVRQRWQRGRLVTFDSARARALRASAQKQMIEMRGSSERQIDGWMDLE